MSLSDCEKCWDTPCTCGHNYRNWSPEKLREQIAMLERVLVEKQVRPAAGKAQPVVTAADYMAAIHIPASDPPRVARAKTRAAEERARDGWCRKCGWDSKDARCPTKHPAECDGVT